MVQFVPPGMSAGIPARFPLEPHLRETAEQHIEAETPIPESRLAAEPLTDNNQTQPRTDAELEPIEVTFSDQALEQIRAWGPLKYNDPTTGTALNPGTDLKPNMVAFDPSRIEQARIAVLDRDGDHQISREELSLNGDKTATKKEFEFLLRQGLETFKRNADTVLTEQPRPLPVKFSGPAMAEFNNPEANIRYGMQGRVQVPLREGKANAYLYGNKGLDGSPMRKEDATHSLVVRNPSTTQPMLVKVSGSFINKYNKNDPQDQAQYQNPSGFIAGAELLTTDNGGDVRRSDHELARRMVHKDHELKDQYVLIPPGGALDLRSFTPSDDADFRAFYQIEALSDYPQDYQGPRGGTPVVPESVQMESVLLPVSQNPSQKEQPVGYTLNANQLKSFNTLLNQKGYVEDISDDGIRHELKGSIDFQNPEQAAQALEHDLLPHLLEVKPSSQLGQDEIDGLKSRFQTLLTAVKAADPRSPLSDELLSQMNDWNAEVKMTIQVLEKQNDTLNLGELWKSVIPLGRVVGVKEYSEARAELPTIVLNGSDFEANYSLVMNPFNRAGSDSQPDIIPMQSHSPNAVPPTNEAGEPQGTSLVPPDKSNGQYGVKYEISLTVNNELDSNQPFDIRFGTTDEQGQTDWRNLFDSFDAYLKPEQARFTGAFKITIDGQEHFINLAQGKVQAPESLLEALTLSKGEHKIKIEMYVPTNNTGPHIIQFLSKAQTAA